MYNEIVKSYENAKSDVDRWYNLAVNCDKNPNHIKADTIEAIYWIGRAVMLALLLEKEWGQAQIKEERRELEEKKSFLTEILEGV